MLKRWIIGISLVLCCWGNLRPLAAYTPDLTRHRTIADVLDARAPEDFSFLAAENAAELPPWSRETAPESTGVLAPPRPLGMVAIWQFAPPRDGYLVLCLLGAEPPPSFPYEKHALGGGEQKNATLTNEEGGLNPRGHWVYLAVFVENALGSIEHRYYSPLLGHFLTPDFRAPDIYDPTTFTEPYAYASGNPFAFWDPDGLNPEGSGKNTINLSTSLELRTEIHIRQIWNRIDATLQFLDGSIAGRKQDVITSVDQAYDLATLFRHHSLYLKDPELFHFHRQDSEMFMHLWNNFDLVETLQAVISGVEDDWNKTIYLWDRGKYRQSGFQSGGIQNMIGEFVAPAGMINNLPEPPTIDLGLPNTSGSPLLAGAGGTGTFPSSTPSINDFSNFSVGNSFGGNRGLFNNDLDELLDIELEIANSLGVKPVLLGSDDFAKIANHDVLKFVVTKDGQLFLAPHTVGGHEISHAVIARGNAVLTAGQVNISTFGDIRFGIGISNHSGHYLPSGDSLDIAIEIFKKHGIEFSDIRRIRSP